MNFVNHIKADIKVELPALEPDVQIERPNIYFKFNSVAIKAEPLDATDGLITACRWKTSIIPKAQRLGSSGPVPPAPPSTPTGTPFPSPVPSPKRAAFRLRITMRNIRPSTRNQTLVSLAKHRDVSRRRRLPQTLEQREELIVKRGYLRLANGLTKEGLPFQFGVQFREIHW
jgi:hypothetical protein